VPLVRSAYDKWRELERACGETLLTVTGILEAGHPGSAVVAGSLEASRLHELEHELLSAAEITRRFPAFRLPSDWTGVFQPQGGFLRPERAIRNFIALARWRGADVRNNTRVLDICPGSSAVSLRTEQETIEASAVIVSAGAWIGAFAPELQPHLKLTRQVLGWFSPHEPALFTPANFPVFILQSEDDACYGFPDFAGTGLKAASHHEGRVLSSADDLRQDGGPADEAQIRRLFTRYIPQADGPLTKMRSCIYTRTPDEDFVVDRSTLDPRVILASPCSGHGFKFASVLGEVLADLALDGHTAHDISRFRIDRFG
jgi:sarcosine oxidase